VEINKNIEKV